MKILPKKDVFWFLMKNKSIKFKIWLIKTINQITTTTKYPVLSIIIKLNYINRWGSKRKILNFLISVLLGEKSKWPFLVTLTIISTVNANLNL